MASDWKNFATQMKEKRAGNKRKAPSKILQKEEIIVQRLSAEVSGKAQKYSRIGPREFVPYEYDELAIDKIKAACSKHFASLTEGNMVCDVLAGEQGPSCTLLEQIPDLKVIDVRFVEANEVIANRVVKRTRATVQSTQSEKKEKTMSLPASKIASKAYPKSLSVVDMMKLGKVIADTNTTVRISLSSFNLEDMSWTDNSSPVEFNMAKEPFAEGGFRKAYKATTKDRKQWVIKKYLDKAVTDIKAINETVEQQTKKVIQMHMLARNFTLKLEQELKSRGNLELYGETLSYKKIYMGKIQDDDECVTVEEFIDGKFTKYLNNNGKLCDPNSDIREKCESLAHFSHTHSNGEVMVVDMQGSGHSLYDPEVASKDLTDGDEMLFATGNLSTRAINNFIDSHSECNLYCSLLGLRELKQSDGDSDTFPGLKE